MTQHRSRGALAAAALALTLAACGGSGDAESSPSPAPGSSTETAEPAAEPASDEPFGESCAALPAEGEGSVAGMADDPVATAASANPALSTLVEAVSRANLVDALNSAEDITVLAPANPAFEALPADALDALLADNAQLTALLTHHVLEGRLAPDQIAGEQTTLNGDTVTIEGEGADLTVAAGGTVAGESEARVVCGNVQTANATVYIIDQVLTPPAS